MSTHRKLAKSAATIGSLTGLSRVLGFARDLVIATVFGTGVGAEAFVVSFKIPNLFRDLVGEGAANAAFVPALTECHEKRRAEFWRLVSTILTALSAVLAVLVFLGMAAAPWIVQWIAPGFVGSVDPEKYPLTVQLTRWAFPYLFLIGLSALLMGVLNSLKEFTSSAFGPVLLNLSMIGFGLFFAGTMGPMALIWGVLCGGVLQLLCQIPPLLKSGFTPLKPSFRDPAVRQIGKLLIPRALGSAIYQINVFVDSIFASLETVVGLGGQSALYYSNRLFQLPLAIFGVSLAQTLLPTFSTQLLREDLAGFKKTFLFSVRSLLFLILPASVGFLVLSETIVRVIFEHGRFDAGSTQITSSALFYYAFGLLSCCLVKILANAFYAMKDTRTPVKTMFVSVLLNIALSLWLMRPLKIGGLALASSLSATVNAWLLYSALRRRLGPLGLKDVLRSLGRISAACAGMALFTAVYNYYVIVPLHPGPKALEVLALFAGIVLSIALYLGACYLLKVEELYKLIRRA